MRKTVQMKKLLSIVIVFVLLMNLSLPTLANAQANAGNNAATIDKDSELYQLLATEYGEDQVPATMSTLQKLGLLDEEGKLEQFPIKIEGKKYSLEQIKKLLADPKTDLQKMAEVDGQQISLQSLQKILEIEEQIKELEELQDTSDVKITEEHLKSLESLVDQADKTGLKTSTLEKSKKVASLNATGASSSTTDELRSKAIERDDSYDDEVVVSVVNTEVENETRRLINGDYRSVLAKDDAKIYLTFELNKKVNKEVSFSYEMIAGSNMGLNKYNGEVIDRLENMQLGSVAEYKNMKVAGTVTFPANETRTTVELVPLNANQNSFYYGRSVLSAYLPSPHASNYESSKEQIRKYYATGFSRGDYLHFYDFKNFDSIRFKGMNIDIDSYTAEDREIHYSNYMHPNNNMNPTHYARSQLRYYYPNVHSYEGGAYLTIGLNRLSESTAIRNGYGMKASELFSTTDVFDHAAEPAVKQVQAKPGKYKTGQIIPIIVQYNKPMAQGLFDDTQQPKSDNKDPELDEVVRLDKDYFNKLGENNTITLKNGDVALAEISGSRLYDNQIVVDNVMIEIPKKDFQITKNFGMSSMHGYGAIVRKGSKAEDYEVVAVNNVVDAKLYNKNIAKYDIDNIEKSQVPYEDYKKNLKTLDWSQGFSNNPDIEITPAKADAFASITTDKTDYGYGETIQVKVELDTANDATEWIENGGMTKEQLRKKLFVSIGDKEKGVIENLDWKRGEDGLAIEPLTLEGSIKVTKDIVNLVTDAHKAEGTLRAKVYYLADNLNTAGEEQFIMLGKKHAYFTVSDVKYIMPGDLKIEYPTTWSSGEENVVSLIDPTIVKLGYTYPASATYRSPDQFEWTSSDDSIATIDAEGKILPKQTGTVTFTLTAKNNGELPQPTTITSVPIEVKSTSTPTLVLPTYMKEITVEKNQPTSLVWLTNVRNIYQEIADAKGEPVADAEFKVELFEGNYDLSELEKEKPVETWQAPEEKSLVNANTFTIPTGKLSTVSVGVTPSYTVKISTKNPAPDAKAPKLEAVAHIAVKSEAAKVAIDKSAGQFVKDDIGSYDVRWSLDNFDVVNKGDFEFQITKNGVAIPDSVMTFDAAKEKFSNNDANEKGGSYKLKIDPVTESNKAKDVYAITVKAKNSLDSTWSYDSLFLQVYKTDAFKIEVDDKKTTAYTMTNIPKIEQINDQDGSEGILALNRKINLANKLNINHQDFTDLGVITDQFKWQSTNNQVGSIYHQSTNVVDDIVNFGNDSYRPAQSFTLGGNKDGETTITAKHVETGMETALDLTVETLKDKLYLFQFYPKSTTEIVYTDGKGKEQKVETNKDGALALYDKTGIHSDVYVTSKFNNQVYTGVISQESLKSQEGSTKTMDLYPMNILQLRQLAKVEAFFKKENGQPYTGKVTYSGGVYKNGNYAEATQVKDVEATVGADGRLEIIFDTTDFYSKAAGESNAATLSAKDKLSFIIETQFENDAYYPEVYKLAGDTSPVDMIAIGSKIEHLTANKKGKKQPFIAVQSYGQAGDRYSNDITKYNGKFGLNDASKSLRLVTEFMWWGEQVNQQAHATLINDVGTLPEGQSYETVKYPFSDYYTTRHNQVINEQNIWLGKGQTGALNFKLYKAPTAFHSTITAPATLRNMIGVQEITPTEVKQKLQTIKDDLVAPKKISGPSNNDMVTMETLNLLSKMKMSVGPMAATIIPTHDPAVYKTFIQIDQGSISKVDKDGFGVEYQKFNAKALPGVSDATGLLMNRESYIDEKKTAYLNNKEGFTSTNEAFAFGGYYTGEIRFNGETGEWENILYTGGFHAGGEFSYTQNWNMQAGPVPVTFSITVGGGAQVNFDAKALFSQQGGQAWKNPQLDSVNDYLTTLRVIAYVEAFGGIGFDYSIIAAKIGIYGRLTVENTSKWLNQDYLANSKNRVHYGNELTLEGIVGVRIVLKFLFLNFSHDFASLRYSHTWMFNHWDAIQKYWDENSAMPLTAQNVQAATFAYMRSIGEEPMQVIESQTLESRDYLKEYNREWHKVKQNVPAMSKRVASLSNVAPAGTTTNKPTELQSNAYPYANPQVTADGSVAVYLSDGNSQNVEDTVASWMKKDGNGYTDQGVISSDKGYGDTGLKVAGDGNLVAATWVRQQTSLNKQAGQELTNEDILMMNNSAEVMVAIYDGAKWTTHKVTDNQSPDIAPVVAVNNGKVFVAYRNVGAGTLENPLQFQSDNIVYTVFDQDKWSDPEVLYNGSQGSIMGLSAEMLSDGRTAVMYTLNETDEKAATSNPNMLSADSKNNQIVYAIVDTDKDASATATTWKTKGVLKNLQVTEDKITNENPQLTSTKFKDGSERFILAWYTSKEQADGSAEGNIRLMAVDSKGEVDLRFVDSLSALKGANAVKVNPNFTFAKTAEASKSIDQLALIWKDAQTEITPQKVTTRDALNAVKFGQSKDGFYLSGALSLGALPDYTEADSISAYTDAAKSVQAFILGTTYTTDTETVGTIKPASPTDTGDAVPVNVSKSVSAIYTLNGKFEQKFEVGNVLYNPTEIVAGFDLPIQFDVTNQGMDSIESVKMTVDGKVTDVPGLQQLPNETASYVASYTVPTQVKDISYTVEVVFADGSKLSKADNITLDVPDLGVSEVLTLEEKDGQRKLSVPIYNKAQAKLDGKAYKVKFALYKEGVYDDEHRIGSVYEATESNALALIDQGGYAQTIDFDVKSYLQTLKLSEIPKEGLDVFLHAWVEDSNGKEVSEFESSNNTAKISIENLAEKYKVEPVQVSTALTSTGSGVVADLTMQNTRMAPVASGNVLVNLLDDQGEVVESQFVATNANQLMQLGAEAVGTGQVTFASQGSSVQTVFFQQNAASLNGELSAVNFTGVPLTFDASTHTYNVDVQDLNDTEITAVAASTDAKVTLKDAAGKTLATGTGFVKAQQALQKSTAGKVNEFSIVVEPASAAASKATYSFKITNKDTAKPTLALQIAGNKQSDGNYTGTVEVSLPAYNLVDYDIDKVEAKVDGGAWEAIAYDGSKETKIVDLKDIGQHKVEAKIVLKSGQEFVLNTVNFEIVKKSTPPNPDPGPTPNPDPKPELGEGPKAPEGIKTIAETTKGANDGKLTGVSKGQEYRLVGATTWIPIDTNEVTGLAPGAYEIRVAATSTHKAGKIATVKIEVAPEETEKPDPSKLKDIQNHWAEDYIEQFVEKGYIQGYEDQTFRPNNPIRREHFALIYSRIFDFKVNNKTKEFEDVPPTHRYYKAIMALRSKGIITGSNNEFNPQGFVTRAHMAKIIVKTYKIPLAKSTSFTDVPRSHWSYEYVAALEQAGIAMGDDGQYKPNEPVTRAQFVALLSRAMEKYPKK